MIHARRDYDAIQPFPTRRPHIVKIKGETVDASDDRYLGQHMEPLIPDDEPVFLIRGQDLAAIPAAEAWCAAARALGADEELVATVERHMDLVRAWQRDHAKVPDAPAGVLR